MKLHYAMATIICLASACDDDDRAEESASDSSAVITAGTDSAGNGGTDSSSNSDDDDDDGGGDKLDVGSNETDGVDCGEGEDCPDACEDYQHVPCDAGTSDVFNAMGINCADELQVVALTNGNPASIGVRTGFGPTGQWAPREGDSFAVLSSGNNSELDTPTPQGDNDDEPTHCNDGLGSPLEGGALPTPIRVNDVAGDCTMDASLIGTGDCSSTINGQYSQGGPSFDYAEMRVVGEVPEGQNSLSFDLAFFSTEYPEYFGSPYNDMFIGWLESESWTGNVSFDEMGQPISLNAGFLDFRDDGGGQVPEFANTCMKRHAGTKWLNTTAPVTPGEEFILVLAIFDLSDPFLDSYVFLDNWQWGCEGMDAPQTTPVG